VLRLNHFNTCPDALPPVPRANDVVVTTPGHDCSVPEIDCLGRTLNTRRSASRTSPTDGSNEQTESLTVKVKITKRGKTIPHNRQTPAPPIPNHVRMQSNYQQSQIRTGCPSFVA
jgi:hypothetical protein